MIEYRQTKDFAPADIEALFRSVDWFSGNFPERLQRALTNSSTVISAWDGDRLVGLIRGLDDGIWQATIDCLLVCPDYQGRGIASALLKAVLENTIIFCMFPLSPTKRRMWAFMKPGALPSCRSRLRCKSSTANGQPMAK